VFQSLFLFQSVPPYFHTSCQSIEHARSQVKAIFHCGRFARAGGATNFNHVKNQSRGMTSQTAPDWQLQIGESGASSRYNFNLELERLVCKQTALAA
jgi:hypothetical protein